MKNVLKRGISLTVALLLVVTSVGCSGGSKQAAKPAEQTKQSDQKASAVKIALSHNSSNESPWEVASKKFVDIVNKESNGKYAAQTYPNGVLVQKNWKIMFEMTQSGSNQIAIESITALSSLVPELAYVQIPFLFNDDAHITTFLNNNSPILQKWLKKFEEKNMVVLGVAPRKFRQLINNKRMVKTPEDISGLKFRVPDNPMFVEIFTLMGAKPVPLPSGEIYSAIQLGTVVGEDNSLPVIYDFKSHEVAKNMTIWNYIADGSLIVINKDVWTKMDDKDKEIFKKAAKEWIAVNIKEDNDYQIKARADMEKSGVKFYEMSAAEKEPFKKLVQPLYDKAKTKLGAEDYDAFVKAVEAARK